MKKLEGRFLEPRKGKAKQMIMFLHGYGANGDDLLNIGEDWGDELTEAVFLSPNAPEICDAFAGGYQWFPLDGVPMRSTDAEQAAAQKAKIEKVRPVLDAYIDEQLQKWGVDESKLVVAGFSQGAMMAMYAMPRRKKACAGVIGYSGLLIDAQGLKEAGVQKVPVLAIHGDADEIVSPAFLTGVQAGFTEAGFDVETVLRPGLGHGIDQFGLIRGLEFIKEVFEK